MNFGLFFYCQGRGVSHNQAYAEMLEQIELGEQLGFTEAWFVEHHFSDYSLLPSPNLIIASAVQRTKRMRFGNYINVMPFHHPLRLAAEAAMLDNLSGGRYDFGLGRGVRPDEFTKFGLDFADAAAMTDEALDIIVRAWTEEQLAFQGRFWSFPELQIRPRPLQKPHPPLHMVATRPTTVVTAAERGWPVAMHFPADDVIAQCVQDYRRSLSPLAPAIGPFRARFVLARETFVAESEQEAKANGALAVLGFWHFSNLLPPPSPSDFSDERLKQLTTRVLGGKTWDEIDRSGIALTGTPGKVLERVRRYEAMGVDTLLLLASFGNLSHEDTCRSMELFASAAMPAAQAIPAG